MTRDTLADAARHLVGGTDGRRIDDPIVQAVTEGRIGDGYSSCADLPHTLRFLAGCRNRVNRREAGGHQYGARTMAWLCETGRVRTLGHPAAVVPRTNSRLEACDTIILDIGDPKRTHTCVVLEHRAGSLITADYGQHPLRNQRPEHIACRVVERPLSVRSGRLWAGDRPIDSWLPLEAELAWQRAQGTLREATSLESWLAGHRAGDGDSELPTKPDLPKPSGPSNGSLRGLDVSAYQLPDSMDWGLLAELGFSFVYVRGVRMGRELDAHAVEHVRRARAAGFSVGLYAFFVPTQSIADQIRLMADAQDACGIGPADLAPALDIESYSGGDASPSWVAPAVEVLAEYVRRWGNAVRYHNVRDWGLMRCPEEFTRFPLWLADYSPPADLPCMLWQHRSALVPGVAMVLDQNVAHANLPRIGHPMDRAVVAPPLAE